MIKNPVTETFEGEGNALIGYKKIILISSLACYYLTHIYFSNHDTHTQAALLFLPLIVIKLLLNGKMCIWGVY